MKKRLPIIITSLSILIIAIYMIVVNLNSNNKIKLENISGDINELNDVSLDVYRSNGIVLTNNFIINKDGIKKDGLINLHNNIARTPMYEDREFYRGNYFMEQQVYENNDLRFAVNINQNYGRKKVEISYRDKKSGELIQFNVDADSNWYFTKAVYSNNHIHKIMFESENNNYVIVDVNLKNKSLKVDKILQVNEKVSYDNLVNRMDRNINDLDKWYFYEKEIDKKSNGEEYNDTKLVSRKLVSVDPNNYDIDEYSLDVKKGLSSENYLTYSYGGDIYDIVNENNELTVHKINVKNQQEKLYKNITIPDELKKNKDNYIRLYKGFVKNEKFYCIFEKYNKYKSEDECSSIDFYINVIDLKSKKSLYLGKVINAFGIGFNRQGSM